MDELLVNLLGEHADVVEWGGWQLCHFEFELFDLALELVVLAADLHEIIDAQ